MAGQSFLPEILKGMEFPGIEYRWLGAYHYGTPRVQIFHTNMFAYWKPLLVYSKEGAQPKWTTDYISPDPLTTGNKNKRWHKWNQSVDGVEKMIRMATGVAEAQLDGTLIADPFLGGGSTALACARLGADFIGCDVDEESVQTTWERLML